MERAIRQAVEWAASSGGLVLDAAFPPRCPSCQSPVGGMHNFCTECFSQLRLIAEPMCQCCGIPFAVAMEGQCPECLAEPPAFSRIRSVMVYDGISAPLVSALKFHDQWAGLARYVGMMRGAGAALLEEADLLVPVPLNWRRLWRRKYNQAALLAYGLAQLTGKPCAPDALLRARATPPQMRLSRVERRRNVKGAFHVVPRALPGIENKHILLIDDVVTTGATVEACALTLLGAGAKQVDVLALARTVKE
jgi:ComF family protein